MKPEMRWEISHMLRSYMTKINGSLNKNWVITFLITEFVYGCHGNCKPPDEYGIFNKREITRYSAHTHTHALYKLTVSTNTIYVIIKYWYKICNYFFCFKEKIIKLKFWIIPQPNRLRQFPFYLLVTLNENLKCIG